MTLVYVSEDAAITVALAAAFAVGVPHFVFKCPAGRGNHVAPTVTGSGW